MPAYFLDSSSVVKRYVLEAGTDWVVAAAADPANRLYIAAITAVEVISAVRRRQGTGDFSAADASRLILAFRADLQRQYQSIEINSILIERAMSLAEEHALRGYDAVQLAAAMELADICRTRGTVMILASADVDLNAAATAEGLQVLNPALMP